MRKSTRCSCLACVFGLSIWLLVTALYLTPCNGKRLCVRSFQQISFADDIEESLQFENKCPTVTVATVCLGTQSARHFNVLLKSLLLHSTSHVVYYILTDTFTQKLLKTTFELWPLDVGKALILRLN